MSKLPSLVLVLLLYVLHACNARSLGTVPMDSEKQLQYYTGKKNNQKVNPGSVPTQPDRKFYYSSVQPDAPGDEDQAKMENRFQEEKLSGAYNEPGTPFHAKDERVKVSALGKTTEALVSESTRVHHRKRGEPNPGFNLDYLPPKTHPPVHN